MHEAEAAKAAAAARRAAVEVAQHAGAALPQQPRCPRKVVTDALAAAKAKADAAVEDAIKILADATPEDRNAAKAVAKAVAAERDQRRQR